MSDLKGAARQAMAAQLLSSVITDEHKPVKAALLADMRDLGVERLRVVGDDDADLGTVAVTAGRRGAKVTDERAFLAWVLERHPGEIVQVVRESFTRAVLDRATAAGDPVDPATGEVIPGVEIAAGDPYLTVRPAAEAKARMRDAVLKSGLLQLPAGGAE